MTSNMLHAVLIRFPRWLKKWAYMTMLADLGRYPPNPKGYPNNERELKRYLDFLIDELLKEDKDVTISINISADGYFIDVRSNE